jgi:hypothetical protein
VSWFVVFAFVEMVTMERVVVLLLSDENQEQEALAVIYAVGPWPQHLAILAAMSRSVD